MPGPSVGNSNIAGTYCHGSLMLTVRKGFSSRANLPTHRSLKVIHSRVKSLLAIRLHAPKISLITKSLRYLQVPVGNNSGKTRNPTKLRGLLPLWYLYHLQTGSLSATAYQLSLLSHTCYLLGSHDHLLQLSLKLSWPFLLWHRDLLLFLKCNKMKQSLSDFLKITQESAGRN